MQQATVFKRLGFGKNAHSIYAALFKSGTPLLVMSIASAAGVDRPEVYRNLKKLKDSGFVTAEKIGKRTGYRAESPEKITEAFTAAVREVAVIEQKLAKSKEQKLPAHITYFKGFAGIRSVFDQSIDMTPKGETFYRYTSERNLAKVNSYLSPSYRERRDRKKLERLVISNPVSGKQKHPRLERFIKYIPQEADLFEQDIIQLIYSDRLAFINLVTEEAFVIQDAALVSFQKVIFKQLYKSL